MSSKILERLDGNYNYTFIGTISDLSKLEGKFNDGNIFYCVDENNLYTSYNNEWTPMFYDCCCKSSFKESKIITSIKNNNCPNCGAPIKISYKGLINCVYCDSLIKIS